MSPAELVGSLRRRVLSILSMGPPRSADVPDLPIVDEARAPASEADGLWDWPGRPHPDDDLRATDDWGTIG